jgi:YtkA-like
MKSLKITPRSAAKRAALAVAFAAAALAAAACGHLAMMGRGVERPAAEAFGLGPRVSEKQTYIATLQPAQPLRVRRLQAVPVLITDTHGRPVEAAVISVDGGMPEHGHGLPTQPRVTRALGGGVYEIEGLRFSMGGWWELKLAIDSSAGADRVTFNLGL